MKYKHILVALELAPESHALIDRAVVLAKQFDAEVSFVHIDGSHGEIYPEVVDIQSSNDKPISEHSIEQLRAFEEYADCPIKKILIGTGDLNSKLNDTISSNNVDMLICGHHHDFWSSIVSYSKHLINASPIDILVVPIE